MKYFLPLIVISSTFVCASEIPEGLKPSSQEVSQAPNFLKTTKNVSTKRQTSVQELEPLSSVEPEDIHFQEAEEFVASSKTRAESFSKSLDSFLDQVPQAPSQKVMKEVQAFLEKGTPCNKDCTSSVDLDTPLNSSESSIDVFVSLSLGEGILRRLYKDVSKVGGRLVLRGLVEDSFPKTQQAFRDLEIGVDIDSPAFDENNIRTVPTFVLKEGSAQDRVSGVRSLESVLEMFAFQGETKSAKDLLKALRKRERS